MNNKTLLVGVGAIVLVAAGVWAFSGGSPRGAQQEVQQIAQPKQQTFAVQVKERKQTPDIVTVTQGDIVTMRVMSDETGEYHVSGYEIENDMEAGKQLEFTFTADKAGRYNFELHPKAEGEESASSEEVSDADAAEAEEDIVIGAFVVNPR